MRAYVEFGSKKIRYKIDYSERRSLGITVTPDMEIVVKAPLTATLTQVNDKVKRKIPWILKQQSFFLSYYPKSEPKKFISGESHLYLGKHYRLRVLTGLNAVKLKGRFIEITCRDKRKAKKLLTEWYIRQARAKFALLTTKWLVKFKKYKVEPKGIVIRTMPTRWGSCTPKGKIILNPELIKAPAVCIEYVIMHELCHLVYRNHTQKFMDLQSKEMPDWEKWKGRLERMMA